jgi:hypothetical protein
MSAVSVEGGAGLWTAAGEGRGAPVDPGGVSGVPVVRPADQATCEPIAICLEAFGDLMPISRAGGQGRVHRPAHCPQTLAGVRVVVKLYRRPPPAGAVRVLAEMIAWSRSLEAEQRLRLAWLAAWPRAIVVVGSTAVGIAMHDAGERFAVPFEMPSGRRERVLLSLEHLLGPDSYLQMRGLDVRLDTATRALVAERVSCALGSLHRHGIVVGDIAPNNLLINFRSEGPEVCFIDCDSMVFHGRQALAAVETGDWQMPAGFGERPQTRAADAYKLGLVILRLFTRSHDARALDVAARQVPEELRPLLARALDSDAANRPPAGEWQRALRQVIAGGPLNERHVHPPQRSEASRVAAPVQRRASDQGRPTRPPRRAALSPATHVRAPARVRRSGGRSDLIMLAWMVIGAVVLTMLLARLFAASIPSPNNTGLGPAVSGATPNGVYQYYESPSGPVLGSGNP